MNEEKICKYCGEPIPKGGVWNPDEHGDGYHHKCLIDMEFDENEAYMKNHAIIISDNATNGDVIKVMFPNAKFDNAMPFTDGRWETISLDTENRTRAIYKPTQLRTYADWWNAPYKVESEEIWSDK